MVYSGNRLFNSNNAFFIVTLGLFLFLVIIGSKQNQTIAMGGVALVMAIVMIFNAFYFEISGDEFIVRNYTLPFMVFRYQLKDIMTIELNGTNYRSSADAALKVIGRSKDSPGFRSLSLNVDDWQNLVNDLHSKKIAIEVNAIRLTDKIGIPED